MKRIFLTICCLLISVPLYACTTDGYFPDPECTPTSVYDVTTKEICVRGYSATVRKTTRSMKNKVYEMYGIPVEERKNYVLDHVISLQLGGRDHIDNLFPQNREGDFNSRDKDRIENWLKRSVCKGEMDLKDAQEVISEDWLSVWINYQEING